MNIDEIWVGQLLVIKKLEEIPDEVNDNMKPWCGRVVKVAAIDKEVNGEDGPPIIRLAECLDEDWFAEDFEKEAAYQDAKPMPYPFYTPSERNTAYFKTAEKKSVNPNKAFKIKKFGAPKKEWKITEMAGRINPCGEIGVNENKKARVIEFNSETKQYEYVEMESNVKFREVPAYNSVTLTQEQLNNHHAAYLDVVYNLNTVNIKTEESYE